MTRKNYSPFHSLVQKVLSTRFGAWYGSLTAHHFDRMVLKLTGGRMTMGNIVSGLPVAVVTTIGAKSGLSRTLPLLFIRDEHDPNVFALIASNWGSKHHPAWYFNLKANPHATCSIRGQVREYVAHEASGEAYDRFWQYAMGTYLGFPLYKQRAANRHIPIMVMTPVEQ